MTRLAALTLLAFALTGIAIAANGVGPGPKPAPQPASKNEPIVGPEIDANTAGSAIALLCGAVLIMRSSKKNR